MRNTRKARASIGDVIEVQTPKGLAYAQFSHRSERSGELIRVLRGVYPKRPESFAELVNSKERFYVFFSVNAAIAQNLISIVAKEEVPEKIRAFPLMRMPGLPDREGKVRDWWLYDGEREWPVHTLTPEQQNLSIAETWSYPILIKRIEEDWSPLGAYSPEKKGDARDSNADDQLATEGNKELSTPTRMRIEHYLYFPTKILASKAARILNKEGLTTQVRRGADDVNWLVTVSYLLEPKDDKNNTRSHLESLASSLGGQYDGEEIGSTELIN